MRHNILSANEHESDSFFLSLMREALCHMVCQLNLRNDLRKNIFSSSKDNVQSGKTYKQIMHNLVLYNISNKEYLLQLMKNHARNWKMYKMGYIRSRYLCITN